MANIYKASCKCGFKRSMRTGGNRDNFQTESYFPFYCKECGLVNVNIKEPHSTCPSCKSIDLKPCGHRDISLDNKWKTVQCSQYEAPNVGNLCPNCLDKTLSFELVMITS